jgi:HSP20 family protein
MSNLVRYNQPLTSIFDEFGKNINRFLSAYPVLGNDFSSVGDSWLPDVDVKEEDKFYVVKADVPGMEKKDIKISIDQQNNLVIEGERDTEIKKEKKGYLCFERYKGAFFRKIALPGAVDAQGIKATYQSGVLEVNVPKSKETVVKQISIED